MRQLKITNHITQRDNHSLERYLSEIAKEPLLTDDQEVTLAKRVREGDAGQSPLIARGYDKDYHFMLVEISDNGFYFQAINRLGVTVDAGSLKRSIADTTDRR